MSSCYIEVQYIVASVLSNLYAVVIKLVVSVIRNRIHRYQFIFPRNISKQFSQELKGEIPPPASFTPHFLALTTERYVSAGQ